MPTGFPVSDEDIKRLKVQILRELSAAPYPREALPLIAGKHGITVDDAKALVGRHGWPDAGAMGRAADVLDGNAPPLAPAPAAARQNGAAPSPRPGGAPANGTEQLIAAGEKSAKARTRRLAAKVRADLKELRELVIAERKEAEAAQVKAEATARLKAEVADLERQLAEKRAALRPPGVEPMSDRRRAENQKIRAWAAEQGMTCPAVGRLPLDVVLEYRRAHTIEGEA